MPQVLVDPKSGLAEAHDNPEQINSLLQQGYHVPLHDTEGNAWSAPYDEASQLVHSGQARQPTPDELDGWLKTAHFQSPTEQAKTFAEGGAEGLFGAAAPAMEMALGVPRENINIRKTLHPGTHLAGQLTTMGVATLASDGFFGPAMATLSKASLPGILGEAGAAASGAIKLTGTFGSIARAATAGALQSGAYQASHEASESLLGNSDVFSEHALANVGISALLGGALGGTLEAGVGPFSKVAKMADKTQKFLEEHTPESSLALTKGPFKNYPAAPGAALFENATASAPIGEMAKGAVQKEIGEMGPKGYFDLFMNPAKATAEKVSRIAGKMTLPYLAKTFPDQLGKAASLLETYKMGLNTMASIEKQSAGLFGYGAFEALKPSIDYKKLDPIYDRTKEIQTAPTILIDNLQKKLDPLAEHLPNTTVSLSKAVSNAANFLNGHAPSVNKAAPLDPDRIPSQSEITHANEVASIVKEPLSIYQHIKEGSLSSQHVSAMQAVYPGLLGNIQKETLNNLMKYQGEKNAPLTLPMQVSLSRLFGQPMTSSLMHISTNQMAFGAMNMTQAQKQAGQMKPSKSGISKMKLSSMDQTAAQRAQERRMKV